MKSTIDNKSLRFVLLGPSGDGGPRKGKKASSTDPSGTPIPASRNCAMYQGLADGIGILTTAGFRM